MKHQNKIVRLSVIAFMLAITASTTRPFQSSHSGITYTGGSPPTGFLAQFSIFYGTVGTQTGWWGWTLARYNRAGFPLHLHTVTDGLFNNFVVDTIEDTDHGNVAYATSENYWFDSNYECGRSLCEILPLNDPNYKKAFAEVED